jgi:hypothetical protein
MDIGAVGGAFVMRERERSQGEGSREPRVGFHFDAPGGGCSCRLKGGLAESHLG